MERHSNPHFNFKANLLNRFKHISWQYAFRMLKATFYASMGTASDTAALENVRAIQNVASARGDSAMSVFASTMEGFALLKTSKEGNMERVQSCVAQIAKFQFDPSAKVMQLDVLAMLLDFAASLHHHSPETTNQKLRQLQHRLDECEDWHNVKADFRIPIKRQAGGAKTVSEETSAIICAGPEGEDGCDYVVMSFMTKMELRSLV